MVIIDVRGKRATVKNGVWKSDDADLVDCLSDLAPSSDFGPADGDIDYAMSAKAVSLLGGTIVSKNRAARYPADTVF